MIQELIVQVEEARKRLEEQQTSFQEMQLHYLTEMRKALESGETTGDPISDALLHRAGHVDQNLYDAYQKVQDALKDKTGELVVIHFTKRVKTKHVFMGPSTHEERPGAFIGVLAKDTLKVYTTIPGCPLAIATHRFAASDRVDGFIGHGDLLEGCDELGGRTFAALNPERACVIIAGDELVLNYIQSSLSARAERQTLALRAVALVGKCFNKSAFTQEMQNELTMIAEHVEAVLRVLKQHYESIKASQLDLQQSVLKGTYHAYNTHTVFLGSDADAARVCEERYAAALKDILQEVGRLRAERLASMAIVEFRELPNMVWANQLDPIE